jgi:hypothetical protein
MAKSSDKYRCYKTVENLKMWDWGPHHYVEDGNRIELNFELLQVCYYICMHTNCPGEVGLARVYQQIFGGDKYKKKPAIMKFELDRRRHW